MREMALHIIGNRGAHSINEAGAIDYPYKK